MITVDIYYQDFGTTPVTFEHVATVTAPDSYDTNQALEYAFSKTQNIDGSWSRGRVFEDGSNNHDYDPNITVVKLLEEHDGKVYGHRSSMMGDIFELNGKRHRVAALGFEEITNDV